MLNVQVIKYFFLFVIMVLVQVLICNRIVLFDCAIPILFFYFIVRLPMGLGMNLALTFSFLLGLTVDIFSDTLGVNALACTLLVMLRKPVYYLYVAKDDKAKDEIPTLRTLGAAVYSKYLLTLTALYCLMLFSFDFFSITETFNILKMAGASTLLSFPLLLCIDSIVPVEKVVR